MRVPEWSLARAGAFDGDFARAGGPPALAELHGRSILLTGATGFFGLWLIEYLDFLRRTSGLDVTIHALSRDPGAVRARHPVYRERAWLNLFEGDVRSFASPAPRLDYVVHGATETSAAAGTRPLDLFDVVYAGTRRVLETAAETGCRRVLSISSGGVYGPVGERGPIAETRATAPDTMRRASAYGEGKRVAEMLGTCMADGAEFEVVTARCFAFVGAGLPFAGHFAIGNFIRDAIERRDIRLASTGRSVRSYLYAADLAVWLFTILLRGRAGTAYNVGSDRAIDIHATASLVRDLLAPERTVGFVDDPATEATCYVPDIARARAELGLDVWTDLETAIRRTAEDAARIGPCRGRG